MEQKLIEFSKVILLCFIFVLSSCENENLTTDNPNPSFSNAKSKFEEFKAREDFQPIFKDLIYNWQDATITRLTDGTEAITVPVVYPNQSQDYYGHKIMYLYPKNKGSDYDVSLFEFIPNPKKIQTKQNTIDFSAFDGYIINWDLVNGFVKGAKFEQNLSVEAIRVKVIENRKKNNNTHKEAPIIKLDEVVIIRPGNNNTGSSGYTFAITGNYAPFGTGTTAGNYSNSPYVGGGRGGNNSNSNSQTNPCDQLKKMIDNPVFKAKIDELKKKTTEKKENGFVQNIDGTFNTLTANGSHSLNLSLGMIGIGYMHTHQNPYKEVDTNGDEVDINPIKMFSPKDVMQFLLAVRNAQLNKKPISDAYGVMVSSSATYQLAFKGNVADILSKYSSIKWNRLESSYKKKIRNNGVEKGFLEFLKDKIGINGIELYKIEDTKYSNITVDSNGIITAINCN